MTTTITPPTDVVRKVLPPVSRVQPQMGADPEFFFVRNGKVVGAETILPKAGLKCGNGYSKIIIDGVQGELNPHYNWCRANFANELADVFRDLKDHLTSKGFADVAVDVARVNVKVGKEEMDSLCDDNKRFGCTPSYSAYRDTKSKISKVDPTEFRERCAGGHIHIAGDISWVGKKIKENPDDIIKMMDIICGNTCVLIDRDKGNKKRRQLYGRAGEYRLPKHGIEYRTLSNFWLNSYHLMSLSFGLARLAILLASHETHGKAYIEAFTNAVDIKKVRRAINNNDFDLAYENFKAIEPLIMEVTKGGGQHFPFTETNIKEFHYFVKTVNENGLKHWFKDDVMTHWCNLPEAHLDGMFNFLSGKVRNEMRKSEAATPAWAAATA